VSDALGWAAVGVLAVLGATARSLIDRELTARTRSSFPAGILAINLTGALALGVLAGAGVAGWPLRLAGSALLGSYTTFSTWIVDTGSMARAGEIRQAAANLVGSAALGLAAVSVGWALGSLW
jgi:fluoride exporter